MVVAGLFATPVRAQDDNAKPTDEKKAPDTQTRPQGQDGQGPGGQDRGGPGGRGNRGGGRFGLPIDELKQALGLTDDQVKQIEALGNDMRDEFRKMRDEMQNNPDANPRDAFTKIRDKMYDKIRGILTAEQKPKFEEWAKKQEERMQRGPQFGPDPERMKKRLLDQAEKELTLSPEEKSAVMPLVQKLLDVRAEVRVAGEKRRDEFKTFVRKADATTDAQKAELANKLAEYRKAVDEDKKKIKDAEQALREVLTIDNEAKLVGIGVLMAD
jgi:Spy/CpxP family protein refolding chaperone